jgi:hypothetical protein
LFYKSEIEKPNRNRKKPEPNPKKTKQNRAKTKKPSQIGKNQAKLENRAKPV